MSDDFTWDDDDMEEFLATWDEVDREAGDLLATLCRDVLTEPAPRHDLLDAARRLRQGVVRAQWPYPYFDRACGWAGQPPENDLEAWLTAAAASISPTEDPGTASEEQAAVIALLHADWLAAVVGLVRRGVGARFDAAHWVQDVADLPEIDDESDDPEGESTALEGAVEVLSPLWQALGVLDDDRRLTALGRWGLPRALLATWSEGTPETDELDGDAVGTALEILASGPLAVPDLRAELAKQGVFADESKILTSLQWREEICVLESDRLAHLPSLAGGSVLTHRVRADELETGVLDATIDLDLWHATALDGVPFTGGGQLTSKFRSDDLPLPDGASTALAGPAGWLDGLEPGDTVGLRYDAGALALERRPRVVDDPAAAALLQRTVRRLAESADLDRERDFPGVDANDICLEALIERPDVFQHPLAPLRELLVDIGLEIHHGWFGVPGTSWHGEPEWLSDDQRAAYRQWRQALARHRDGEPTTDAELVSLVTGLDAVVGDLVTLDLAAEVDREPLVEAMQHAVSGRAVAVPLYLRARAAEGRGDVLTMKTMLEACVEADPDARDAVADLADLRALEGDAREAHRLYTLADVAPGAPEVAKLRAFLSAPASETGRNQPCPCGSGKKYKLCHGRAAQHPLVDRGGWLLVKVTTFLQRGLNRETLLDWAELLSGAERADRETVLRAMADSTTWDFALFDGGVLSDFLEQYRPLLPADEAQLVEAWLGSSRRLLEVTEVQPMRGATCRDLVTGEVVGFRDRTMTRTVAAKDLLYGRLLDQGDGVLRFWNDPLSIPRLFRSRLLGLLRTEPPAEAVASFLAPASTPPTVQTTEGEELVMSTARYDVPDLESAWADLSERLEVVGEVLQDSADVPGRGQVVRGTVRRAGKRLSLETMSIERLRRLQALLLEAVPAARLVEESTRPVADIWDDRAGGMPPPDSGSGPALAPDDVAEIVLHFEEQWVTERIPALGGLTPREAAADADAREELAALLDDFEWQNRQSPQPFAMDVDRLRSQLDL